MAVVSSAWSSSSYVAVLFVGIAWTAKDVMGDVANETMKMDCNLVHRPLSAISQVCLLHVSLRLIRRVSVAPKESIVADVDQRVSLRREWSSVDRDGSAATPVHPARRFSPQPEHDAISGLQFLQ